MHLSSTTIAENTIAVDTVINYFNFVGDIANELNHNSMRTMGRWIKRLKNVAFDAAICQSEPIGGIGIIVEIDESKFGER